MRKMKWEVKGEAAAMWWWHGWSSKLAGHQLQRTSGTTNEEGESDSDGDSLVEAHVTCGRR